MSMYITPEAIANELDITAKTVRDWLRSGELVGVKVGSSWRIHQKDFERYLEGQRLAMLMKKAKLKHPDISWVEGQCAHCGVYIPEPKNEKNVVCSPSCKESYDTLAVNVVGAGTPEFLDCCGSVLPHF